MMRMAPDPTDPDFAPYWEGTLAAEIRIPECVACGVRRWPPRPVCTACGSSTVRWTSVPPTGHLYSWTVIWHRTDPSFDVPYTVALVELDAGVRMLGNLVDGSPDETRAGQPMVARFQPSADGAYALVNWAVDTTAAERPVAE